MALKASAKAHNVEFCDWRNGDGEVALKGDNTPIYADVSSIVSAFAENSPQRVIGTCFGYTEIFTDCIEYRKEVDEMILNMALPYGAIINYARK